MTKQDLRVLKLVPSFGDLWQPPVPARRRGQMDALQGKPCYYGCHFGMRSTKERDMAEYVAGWQEVDFALTRGDM